MISNPDFAPTRAAALARIAAVEPVAYARSRNAIEGAVTGLSPYITHGLVTLPEVLVGEHGIVYAVDIQPEMLELLTNKMAQADRKSTRLNSSHPRLSRMPSSA